jgi:hypothetical protein
MPRKLLILTVSGQYNKNTHMSETYAIDDLLEFLTHASQRGLMPVATAQAMAVATRSVFAVLDADERAQLPVGELDAVIRRFQHRRARDFNPVTLQEYGRRVKKATELFLSWRRDPKAFAVTTRSRSAGRSGAEHVSPAAPDATDGAFAGGSPAVSPAVSLSVDANSYSTRLPIRPGHVLHLSNIPYDLTAAEAERIAQIVRLLAVDGDPRVRS